jgi:hypothetical protein
LQKIEIKRKVFFMKVDQCVSLKRMEITAQVDRLRLGRCPELLWIVGLKNIVSLLDKDSKEIYEEDPRDLGGENDWSSARGIEVAEDGDAANDFVEDEG